MEDKKLIIAQTTRWMDYLFGTSTSLIINLVIICIAVYIIIRLINNYLRYLKESKTFTSIEESFNNFADRGNLSKLSQIIKDINPDSMIAKRLLSLHSSYQSSMSLDFNIIDEINDKYNLEDLQGSRKVIGMLILFGLLGTILGLTTSLLEMHNIISDQGSSTQAIKDTLVKMLSGLQTGFSTTVAGVAATILLVMLSIIHDKRVLAFISEVDFFFHTKVISAYVLPKKDADISKQLNSIDKSFQNLQGVISSLLQITERSVNQYKFLYDAANNFEKAVQKMMQPFEQQENMQNEIVAAVRENKILLDGFKKNSEIFSTSMGGIVGKLDSLTTELASMVSENRLMRGQLKEQTDKVGELTLQFSTSMPIIAATAEELKSASLQIKHSSLESVEEIKNTFEIASEILNRRENEIFTEIKEKLIVLPENLYAKTEETLKEGISFVENEVRNIQEENTVFQNRIVTELSEESKGIKEVLESFLGNNNEKLESFIKQKEDSEKSALLEVSDSLKSLIELLKRSESRSDQVTNQFSITFSTLESSISKLNHSIAHIKPRKSFWRFLNIFRRKH